MALILSSFTPSGVTGDYWRVIHTTVDAANRAVRVATALYLDQTTRDLGREPVFIRQDLFTYDTFVAEENAIKAAYDSLKTLPDFAEAVDA